MRQKYARMCISLAPSCWLSVILCVFNCNYLSFNRFMEGCEISVHLCASNFLMIKRFTMNIWWLQMCSLSFSLHVWCFCFRSVRISSGSAKWFTWSVYNVCVCVCVYSCLCDCCTEIYFPRIQWDFRSNASNHSLRGLSIVRIWCLCDDSICECDVSFVKRECRVTSVLCIML